MRRTIHKCFFAWNYEKEEKWLNEMSAKGLKLVSVGYCKYVFEEGVKDEYAYKMEYLPGSSQGKRSSYIQFLEETGIEYIGSILDWAYFRKKAADGVFEIYSDIDSEIKHKKRVLSFLLTVTPVELIAFFSSLDRYIENKRTIELVWSILFLICSTLLGLGIFTLYKKINMLKKENIIRE
jgi:hypothetical protein